MDGRIRQAGSAADVFGSPESEEVAAFVGVETIVPGRVREMQEGVPLIEVAGHRIEGGSSAEPGDEVLVCLRPEDVSISLSSQPSSVRNHLSAVVTRLVPAAAYIRVEMDAGFPLVALVTRRAVEELSLAPGVGVVASFKASAVHLIRK
jgi:molybdopterin-binding protein